MSGLSDFRYSTTRHRSRWRQRLTLWASVAALLTGGAARAQADPNFTIWKPNLDEFASADKLRRPEQGGVLFFGSSTFRLWRHLAQDFRQQPVIINRGFGDSTLAACNFFAQELVVQYRPAQGVKFIQAGYGHFKTSALNQRR